MASGHNSDHQVPLELKDYQLTGTEVVKQGDQPKVIAIGSYATVIELRYHGLKCAGKKFHDVLYLLEATPLAKEYLLKMIIEECNTLAKMRHPHIVQFLGVFCTPDCSLPIIVMEYLPTTLNKCIEKYGILIPDEICYTILEDIACALSYLHSKPIVHRDLSTNNILLTLDMRAKISDLGGAKDLSAVPRREMMTKQPGTIDFMPPEALKENPQYGPDIDVFSFGVIVLAITCGEHPTPVDRFQENSPGSESFQRLPEIARRQKYIDQIASGHPMLELLVKECLDNPQKRPTASEVQQRISHEKLKLALNDKDKLDLLKEKKDKDEEIDALKVEQEAIRVENFDLKEKMGQLEEKIKRYKIDTDTEKLRTKEIENLREQLKKHKMKAETHTRDMTRNHHKIHNLEEQRNKALRLLTSNDKVKYYSSTIHVNTKRKVYNMCVMWGVKIHLACGNRPGAYFGVRLSL